MIYKIRIENRKYTKNPSIFDQFNLEKAELEV